VRENGAVAIRPIEAADHEAWYPLWRGYQEFYHADIPKRVSDITWSRLLDSNEPMGGAVAVGDGAVVGIVHWIFHRSCWTEGDYCYLQDLFVAPAWRGKRVGRGLIEFVYDVARAQGCARVHWLTQESNHEARKLYDRIGTRSGFIQYRHLLQGAE
jgi:GNAT superfamily N-acetyltransferase